MGSGGYVGIGGLLKSTLVHSSPALVVVLACSRFADMAFDAKCRVRGVMCAAQRLMGSGGAGWWASGASTAAAIAVQLGAPRPCLLDVNCNGFSMARCRIA